MKNLYQETSLTRLISLTSFTVKPSLVSPFDICYLLFPQLSLYSAMWHYRFPFSCCCCKRSKPFKADGRGQFWFCCSLSSIFPIAPSSQSCKFTFHTFVTLMDAGGGVGTSSDSLWTAKIYR